MNNTLKLQLEYAAQQGWCSQYIDNAIVQEYSYASHSIVDLLHWTATKEGGSYWAAIDIELCKATGEFDTPASQDEILAAIYHYLPIDQYPELYI